MSSCPRRMISLDGMQRILCFRPSLVSTILGKPIRAGAMREFGPFSFVMWKHADSSLTSTKTLMDPYFALIQQLVSWPLYLLYMFITGAGGCWCMNEFNSSETTFSDIHHMLFNWPRCAILVMLVAGTSSLLAFLRCSDHLTTQI